MKTRIVPLKNSRPALRTVLILNPIVVVCFGLAPTSWAVSPTPDGSYPGGNTAEGGSGALFSLTTGSNNTAVGSQALLSVTNGSQNTAIGAQALKDNLASQNTADGFQALTRNIAGDGNTATGWRALFTNTSGDRNTADGNGALYKNAVGSDNTATGFQALYNNSTGSRNTAYGSGAIVGGGNDNTAVGSGALGVTNVSSNENTALGSRALANNVGGNDNTATGTEALLCNNGSGNTVNGANALLRCPDIGPPPGGSNNTVMGANALSGDTRGAVQNNTVIGAQALPLENGGQNNIAIGYQAGANLPFGDNNIEIGNRGAPGEDGPTIRIGDVQTRAFIAGIRGVTTQNANAVPVLIDSAGQLGTMSSSQRYKHEIKPMDRASEAILALKPVTFEYKSDKTDTPQFGLIAEQVAKVNPDLIVRDEKGEIYSVRYDAVNAMLLNEFLKAHRKIEEQADAIAELKSGMDTLTTALKKQATQMQAMRAQLRMSKMPSQVVAR